MYLYKYLLPTGPFMIVSWINTWKNKLDGRGHVSNIEVNIVKSKY